MILCILAQAKYERDEHLGKNYFWHEWRDLKEIKNKIWRKASWFKLGQITIIWSEYFICILGEELYINKSEIFTALKYLYIWWNKILYCFLNIKFIYLPALFLRITMDFIFSWEPRNLKFLTFELQKLWGFPDGSVVKILPAVQETLVRSLGQKDPLEKEWRILIVIVINNVLYSPDYFCKFHNELQLQIFIAF